MKIATMVVVAGLAAWVPATARAQMAAPNASTTQDGGTQRLISKMNAYVGLLNRTLRASDSLSRYASWVNMKSGPTGKERIIYGLYSVYDVRDEIAKAKEAAKAEPALPTLDAAMLSYVDVYEKLAPILNRAEGYYERKDYKDDGMAQGKAMHVEIAALGQQFRAEREKVDALFAVEKRKADTAELTALEQREGKKSRWHVAHVMMRAREVVDLLPDNKKPVTDMPAFEAAVSSYAAAVREFDEYSAAHPNSFHVFESRPRSLLGKLRDIREKLTKSKGDGRRVGQDLNFLINDYNTMVTTSRSATTFAKD